MNNWYVRPEGGDYGLENGTSHADAWDGMQNLVWLGGGINPGDTLWVAGTFDIQTSPRGKNGLLVGASGTSGSPITIRGDFAGDPGTIWQVSHVFTSGWTGPDAFGAWQHTGVFGSTGRFVWEDGVLLSDGTNLFKSAPPDGTWINGSFYHDIAADILYVIPQGGDDPNDHKYYTQNLSGAIAIVDRDWINVINISLRASTLNDGVLRASNANDCIFDNVDLRWGFFAAGIKNQCNRLTYKNCNVQSNANGIYATGNFLSVQSNDVTIQDCTFIDIGDGFAAANMASTTGDLHACAHQGGNNWTIERNVQNNGGGTFWTSFYNNDHEIKNCIVRYNFIKDIDSKLFNKGGFGSGDVQGDEIGIVFEGDNADHVPDRNTGCKVHHNVVVRCTRTGIHWSAVEATSLKAHLVFHNTCVDCGSSFVFTGGFINGTGTQSEINLSNNISLNPIKIAAKQGWPISVRTGRHLHHKNVLGDDDWSSSLMDGNIWFPDADGIDFFLHWKNIQHSTHAAFKADVETDISGAEANSIVSDPLLANKDGNDVNDFRLLVGSPAIDAGVTVPGLTGDDAFDVIGNPYPSGVAPTIGAYETAGIPTSVNIGVTSRQFGYFYS